MHAKSAVEVSYTMHYLTNKRMKNVSVGQLP